MIDFLRALMEQNFIIIRQLNRLNDAVSFSGFSAPADLAEFSERESYAAWKAELPARATFTAAPGHPWANSLTEFGRFARGLKAAARPF